MPVLVAGSVIFPDDDLGVIGCLGFLDVGHLVVVVLVDDPVPTHHPELPRVALRIMTRMECRTFMSKPPSTIINLNRKSTKAVGWQ